MHPHQWLTLVPQTALGHEQDVFGAGELIVVTGHGEHAMTSGQLGTHRGTHPGRAAAWRRGGWLFLMGSTPVRQRLDGDDVEALGLSQSQDVWGTGAGAVVVDDLANESHGLQTSQPGEVDGGLGVATAGEHTPVPRTQRQDVAGADEIGGGGTWVGQSASRGGPFHRTDPGGRGRDIHRHGVAGAQRIGVRRPHEWQAESVGAGVLHRGAQVPRGVPHHPSHPLRTGELGGKDGVPLVLPILVVQDEHRTPGPQLLQCMLNRRKRHQ